MVQCKRVYDDVAPDDGTRVLVDRLWPRGMSKEAAALDDWEKRVAPSSELRKWFDHDPKKWGEFCRRYNRELDEKSEVVESLRTEAEKGRLTLIYAAKDREHNHALVLKRYLEKASD